MARDRLPSCIRGLLLPSSYPHPAGRIQLIQTHSSYVLIAGDHVYKIKKPVNLGFLDFSTLGKRRHYCRQEVRLNSRLCQDTYLGVSRIREDNGRITVGGPTGRIIDYAVHMRRLPAERMMDRLLAGNKVTLEMVRAVARRLVYFHEAAETSDRIARYGDWAIRFNWNENVGQWQKYLGRTISEEQDRVLRAYGRAFFARKTAILQRRVSERHIKRVHADLRSDAVCFVDGICIFDCVEFSRRIAVQDIARDVGFLAMDLDYRDRPDLARELVAGYVRFSQDSDLLELLEFYQAYSACVRGKVESLLLDEREVPATERRRARSAARRYFALATKYAASLPPAMLIITCGLAGSGKSTLVAALAAATGFDVISSDTTRKQLAGIRPEDRRPEAFESGIYTPDSTQRTYEELLLRAADSLRVGHSVILDATFLRRNYRRHASRLADETGAQFACLELEISDRVARERLDRRARGRKGSSDADWAVYSAQKRRFQKPGEIPQDRRITIDASRPIATQLRSAFKSLRKTSPLSLLVRGG